MTHFHPDGRPLGLTFLAARGGRPNLIRAARGKLNTSYAVDGSNLVAQYEKAVVALADSLGLNDPQLAVMLTGFPAFMKHYRLTLHDEIVQVLVQEEK